ncbi:MAG: YfhO family protein, partial [Oscillospiraceae bacterium]|nr:YfhO family protein [Oscillospiraceae bacterium]
MSEASNNDIINKEEEKDIPLNVADKEQKDLNKKKKFKLFNFLPEKHRKIYAWILSIIVLIAVTLICHKVFVFEGSMFILYDTDSFSQFMQFFAFLQNAFAKGQPFWSFSYGLGGNVFGEFSYYYTTSPFFYLMLIPRLISAHNWNFQEALYAKMIISLIKQFLSMFFLFALLKYEGRKTINALIGAIIYGASLMFARYCVSFDFFTEAFPWVPLTILGFRIYQRKKKPFVLVLGAALTVGNSFYFGFMSVCLYFAYMVFFLVEAKGKNIKDWIVSILKSCYKYFIYAALSMCIASIFFLPTIYAFFNSDRFAQTWNVSLFFTSDFYKTLPERLFNNRDVLAFPFIIIIMIFVLLKITKVSSETRRKTFFVLFFFILYMFPRVYSFFNGFTYVIDRWLYIFIFSVAYALPNWLEEDERLKLTGFSFAIFGGAFLAAMYATKAYRG